MGLGRVEQIITKNLRHRHRLKVAFEPMEWRYPNASHEGLSCSGRTLPRAPFRFLLANMSNKFTPWARTHEHRGWAHFRAKAPAARSGSDLIPKQQTIAPGWHAVPAGLSPALRGAEVVDVDEVLPLLRVAEELLR